MMYTKKGISLIALIITIAVLIIIATVTIQNGMQRTNEARIAKHNINITTTQEEVENYYYYKGGELPVADLTPYPIPSGSALLAETAKNSEDTDTFYILDSLKMGEVSGKNNNTYIVSATRHTVYNLEGTTIKGITYYGLIGDNNVKLAQVPPYNNPIVPKGFKHVGTETWDNGFTIEDANGNQFVWVPALDSRIQANGKLASTNFNSKFGRRDYRADFGLDDYYETYDTTLKNITASINKYGGFYIAKYEASSSNGVSSGKGQSKANTMPWTSINWTDAKAKAESMDTDWWWDTSIVESYLCYGAHWDTALEWLIDSGTKTPYQVINDSRSWGNYTNETFSGAEGYETGQCVETCAKGIYDLAGDINEWTMENCDSNHHVVRGGDRGDPGDSYPAASRLGFLSTYTVGFIGWRPVLYIK